MSDTERIISDISSILSKSLTDTNFLSCSLLSKSDIFYFWYKHCVKAGE